MGTLRVNEVTSDALSHESIDALNQRIADPARYCGGGSAAAITASSAASLALLVLDVNLKRKANRTHLNQMSSAADAIRAIQQDLYQGADDDVAVLTRLLAQYGGNGEDRGDYHLTLKAAAEVPLGIAARCVALLELIESNLARASRFTISDFGAAAALANGALQSALLMTEVNASLLKRESGDALDWGAALTEEAEAAAGRGRALADLIHVRTLAAIRGEG